ncbi:MAG: phosphoserine phosphatase SerB [Casimicrobiaceae bacterium]|nr:phosphoserine phosphatase SerB [Casimicrobiaceae bacterium]MCX8098030.1 phosphoserine phosphatase SerB [Casimicrobiaceae bacterium]MDW8312442.1 phosphoserine phosphatase SerB [Burkholderiales bacterium]
MSVEPQTLETNAGAITAPPVTVPLERLGLLAMDMDSTAITIECIDELADFAGVKAEVAAVTEAAMRGEIDFAESLRRRVACLRGLPVGVLDEVYEQRLRPTPGLDRLMAFAAAHGIRTLLVSGGFTYFTERLRRRFGFTYTRANTLEVRAGRLTGRLCGRLVDAQTKAETLKRLAATLPSARCATLAIGDGANDLAMLAAATLGIAFHAKPAVRAQARAAIDAGGLERVLDFISGASEVIAPCPPSPIGRGLR